MQPTRQIGLIVGIGLVLAIILISASVAYRDTRELFESSNLVAHTHEVQDSLARIVSTVTDAETGQRGYLVTGERQFLDPFESAAESYHNRLDKLATLVTDNPDQVAAVKQLSLLVNRRMDEIKEVMQAFDGGGLDAARELVLRNRGFRTMRELRKLVDVMQRREAALLTSRELKNDNAFRTARLTILLGAAVGVLGVGAFVLLLRQHLAGLFKSAAVVHDQRELLRATLASIGDAVIATDRNGQVTFLNPVAENLTGWRQADAVGKRLEQVFNIVNESSRQAVESPAARALREGRIVGLANHTVLIAKDGSEWPIDDSAAPIRGQSGDINGVILVFREIRERKRHEEELRLQTDALRDANEHKAELLESVRQSEQQFRTLADSIPQLAWMTRPDGSIVWYNRRWYEYTGTTEQQVLGWGWQSVHDPAELPRVLEKFKAAIATGSPWEDTFPLRRYDGQMRWHLSRALPLRDHTGQIVCWFGTNTDISEQLAMEAALKDADRRKDEFLATLAHELRNPLSPLSNGLQLWPLIENDKAEMEQMREMMERQVRQMIRLIDDLMDVSRITRGKIQLRMQETDLGTLVANAVESMQPFIESCGHRLTMTQPAKPVAIEGDVARLTQVFGNILNNAAKYSPRGSVIWIGIDREGNRGVVRIRDNGPGIPQHMLSQIFEMFRQVDQTLDRAHGGLGIGLTLVKRLVELHGGSVVAHSEGPGKGSEFVVSLPVLAAGRVADGDGHRRHVLRQLSSLPRHQVLVVDDVRPSAMTLAMMLRSIGQDVTVAHSGQEALDAALASRPDVIFLDIAMPGMNGYEVARQLRSRGDFADAYLVALTGYGQEDDRRKAIEAGFDYHMTKPTSMEALQQLLAARPEPRQRDESSPVSSS